MDANDNANTRELNNGQSVTRREIFEAITEPEWLDWYSLTPAERWTESERLWEHYRQMGGSLDPEPDSQSPFFDEEEWRELSGDGGTGLRFIRRSSV